MAKRTRARGSSNLSLLLGLVGAADDTTKKLTGKPIAYYFDRFVKNYCRGMVEVPTQGYDPYAVLGVRPDADIEVIKSSFRALARKYHPDTGITPDPQKFQAAKEAYDKIVGGRETGGGHS